MPIFEVSSGNTFAYDHIVPTSESGKTFIFFNALSGDRSMWTQTVGSALQDAGHGLLIWNFRGQSDTTYSFAETSETLIVDDAIALLEAIRPERPVHVGLSIGGLFAIRAHERGGAGRAEAIVLLNTLRKAGPRLDWVNDAVARAAEVGGLELMRDLFTPLLMNQDWQARNRANFLNATRYTPASDDDGAMLLLKSGGSANWAVNYEAIDVPVLSVTGLQDRIFREPADIDDLSARIPKLTRVDLANAGHMIPVERPDELATAMLNFTAALDG